MVLIDTSVWINIFADKDGSYSASLYRMIGGREVFLTRFQQLELLQGSRNETEWNKLSSYLDAQDYLEMHSSTWQAAARIYYDLRKKGLTVRSPIDCCIAQLAMEQRVLLIHDDADFVAIAKHFPLQHLRWTVDYPGRDVNQIHDQLGKYAV
jgi:predicted nucleic acid-binding protein